MSKQQKLSELQHQADELNEAMISNVRSGLATLGEAETRATLIRSLRRNTPPGGRHFGIWSSPEEQVADYLINCAKTGKPPLPRIPGLKKQ